MIGMVGADVQGAVRSSAPALGGRLLNRIGSERVLGQTDTELIPAFVSHSTAETARWCGQIYGCSPGGDYRCGDDRAHPGGGLIPAARNAHGPPAAAAERVGESWDGAAPSFGY